MIEECRVGAPARRKGSKLQCCVDNTFTKCVYLTMTLQVEILNPKATTLLQNLADLNLISIKGNQDDGFMKIVKKLRLKAGKNPPSLDEITKEVESVRSKRYGKQKG